MKSIKILGVGLACLSTVGCYHHSFTVGSGGDTSKDAAHSEWASHWLFGIIGESSVDVNKVCPSGNATLKDYMSFVNGLIGAFIGIIWHPTTVEVYCGAGGAKAASLTLSPEQMRTIALHPDTMAWVKSLSDVAAADLQNAMRTYDEAHRNVASTGSPSTF